MHPKTKFNAMKNVHKLMSDKKIFRFKEESFHSDPSSKPSTP